MSVHDTRATRPATLPAMHPLIEMSMNRRKMEKLAYARKSNYCYFALIILKVQAKINLNTSDSSLFPDCF